MVLLSEICIKKCFTAISWGRIFWKCFVYFRLKETSVSGSALSTFSMPCVIEPMPKKLLVKCWRIWRQRTIPSERKW